MGALVTPVREAFWHDAWLATIMLTPDQGGALDFSHVDVYIETAPLRYDVWSYEARLQLFEVTECVLSGALSEGSVAHGRVQDAFGKPVELADLTTRTAITGVDVQFAEGCTLRVKAKWATFTLVRPIEKFEEWSGPLRST